MSVVWSFNEWDQLEEVIVGNPLGAKWYSAPKRMLLDSLFDVDLARSTPRNDESVQYQPKSGCC